MPALRAIRAPNGMAIVPIHYSHDEEKNAAWAARERAKYIGKDSDWEREYEINFAQVSGVLAYPSFRDSVHVVDRLDLVEHVPLEWWWDFNVSPMVTGIFQVIHGWMNVLRVIELDPSTVTLMCREFRNFYPSHGAELNIYGDAMGSNRDHQTGGTDYDLIRNGMAGYNAPRNFLVPNSNPLEKDRLNSVNAKLAPTQGMPGVRILRPLCKPLLDDFAGVILDSRGKVAKTYDGKNPYSKRTHASDGFGYAVWRLWPVAEFKATTRKPAKPLVYKGLLGEFR
jgi:hypothetical protein